MSNPKIEWVEIPGGMFCMGSPGNEKDRYGHESKHMVTISAFKMSKYAVTFEQYDAFCDEMGFQKPEDEGWGRGNRPVINVTWEDANNFALWMGCSLPTEAEWEYACRAGTITAYNTGNSLSKSQANFDGSKTMPVGTYPPNGWGLYDMHGNVWEWCSDWYDDYNTSAQTNPKGPSSGEFRIVRGGCFGGLAFQCRSAYRSCTDPASFTCSIGFRLASPK